MRRFLAILSILLPALFLACIALPLLRNEQSAKPRIISKAQWGSLKNGDSYMNQLYDPHSQGPLGHPLAITMHHTSWPLATRPPNCRIDRENIRKMQMLHVSKGWGDIGYHFIIGSDGSIYEGRPLGYTGTHAIPNHNNIGIVLIGDFQEKQRPSKAQIASLTRLTSWLCDKYDIDPLKTITLFGQSNLAICGHRDWAIAHATSCPGDRMYALLPSLREKIHSALISRGQELDARVSAFQFLPQTLVSGQKYDLSVSIRNTGRTAWPKVRLETSMPEMLKVEDTSLGGKKIEPLSNQTWQAKIIAPSSPGKQHLALGMADSHGPFGSEIAWDVDVLSPRDFISAWLIAGPFPMHKTEEASSTDFLAGKPLDMFDAAKDVATHNFNAVGESQFVEECVKDERGREHKAFRDWYVEEETFCMSLVGHKGGDVILRRSADQSVGIQAVDVYVDGKWLSVWKSPSPKYAPSLKDLTVVIPGKFVRGNSIRLRVTTKDTAPVGYSCLKYTLSDSGEMLTFPEAGYKAGKLTWKEMKALPSTGVVYLATYVKSPASKQVELRTGYGGYQKAWLNGKLIISGKPDAPNFPDTMKRKVLLKKGWNRLLLKLIVEPENGKELYARFSHSSGMPVSGLEYSVNPPSTGGIK